MLKAYGSTLVNSEGEIPSFPWHSRCKEIIQHSDNLYVLPGGTVGCHYVDLLEVKVRHLAVGNLPSKRLLVFCSVIMQHDRVVKKGADIRRLIERCLMLWKGEKFDLLLQEARRCDRALF